MCAESSEPGTATCFAPPERADTSVLEDQTRLVTGDPIIQAVEEAIDGYLLILNRERQIISINRKFLQDLGLSSTAGLIGRRPGEFLDCIHAQSGPNGCGTSKACSACGAVISILGSQRGNQPTTGECLLTVNDGDHTESFEYRVRCTPVRAGEQEFTVMVLNDISGEKRREALERVFFHDILNTIGGLLGWSAMLKDLGDTDPKTAADKIVALSERLTREIKDQRQLLQAERGELDTCMDWVRVGDVLETVRSIFSAHEVARNKEIEIDETGRDSRVKTDASLLIRILTNMVKNALEAVPRGKTVRVWHENNASAPSFHVWNPGVIPGDVQTRIFQRSFSTKGENGRGLGTYSMKLFGERFLKGRVFFASDREKGTTFSISLPAARR